MRTCARFSVPGTTTTENPGVWISGGERKVCAVGVQVRRGITGHGIALNIRDEEGTFRLEDGKEGGMLSWGFSRIVACGLEGKGVTWLTREGADKNLQVAEVAGVFVEEFAKGLGEIDEIYRFTKEETLTEDLLEKFEDNKHSSDRKKGSSSSSSREH
jgi:lipoate-protein ligase B